MICQKEPFEATSKRLWSNLCFRVKLAPTHPKLLVFTYVTREAFPHLNLELLNGIVSTGVKVKNGPSCLLSSIRKSHPLATWFFQSSPAPSIHRSCAPVVRRHHECPSPSALRVSGAISGQMAARGKSRCQVSPKLRTWMSSEVVGFKTGCKTNVSGYQTPTEASSSPGPPPHPYSTWLSVSPAWK